MEERRVYSKDFHNLLKIIKSLSDNQAEIIEWDDSDISSFIVEISPNDGLYKGGKFKFSFNVDEESWPESSPVINCLTKIYHPNIDKQTDYEPDCDGTNICAEGLEDDWEETNNLDDCIQILLFLFYEPNIGDPLASGFPSALTNEGFAENVKVSLRGGEITIANTESKIEFEPNYGWLQNNQECTKAGTKMGKVESDVISDATNGSDVISDAVDENTDKIEQTSSCNRSDEGEMSVCDQCVLCSQTIVGTNAISCAKCEGNYVEKKSEETIEIDKIPLQRQVSKKDTFSDEIVSCKNESLQSTTMNLNHGRQLPHVMTERYINMCNTLKECTSICIS